ncbi:unnamed protein product [Sphagnum jensenii]|uniref:Uncharacterized protein n=1 Tax=Sphagnum jensenii TaxID=128206 RepID=A0ABP1ABM5_9BRYO
MEIRLDNMVVSFHPRGIGIAKVGKLVNVTGNKPLLVRHPCRVNVLPSSWMGSRIGLLEYTKSRIEQFDRRARDKHIPLFHKLLPLDIREACLAISKNVFVNVPTIEDIVVAREDSCNPIY